MVFCTHTVHVVELYSTVRLGACSCARSCTRSCTRTFTAVSVPTVHLAPCSLLHGQAYLTYPLTRHTRFAEVLQERQRLCDGWFSRRRCWPIGSLSGVQLGDRGELRIEYLHRHRWDGETIEPNPQTRPDQLGPRRLSLTATWGPRWGRGPVGKTSLRHARGSRLRGEMGSGDRVRR